MSNSYDRNNTFLSSEIKGDVCDKVVDRFGKTVCKRCLISPYPLNSCIDHYKLRLLGGSPIWGVGTSSSFLKDNESRDVPENKPKKESHLSKVSILKKKPSSKISHPPPADRISLLSTLQHDEVESCSSSGVYSSISSTGSGLIPGGLDKKLQDFMEEKKRSDQSLINSPEGKQLGCKDIVDYDDDNDNNVISAEVSLSSVAQQNDGEDITVIESFSESNLGNVISSPLESDQMADEYLLFHGNMVDMSDELQCSDKDENEEGYSTENMHIVIRSPTTSDDELINYSKNRKKSMLSDDHFLKVVESNMNEDMNMETSAEDQSEAMEIQQSEVIDQTTKLTDEQISTKEDFEELIDERSRKGLLLKSISTHFPGKLHANTTATSTFSTLPTQHAIFTTNDLVKKQTDRIPQKLSLLPIQTSQRIDAATASVLHKQNINTIPCNPTHKVTSIILHNPNVRKSMISVPNLVTNTSSAITIVNASSSQIASILPSHFTVPLISASAVRQLPNVKVIDKPSTSLSLTSNCLPKNIFEDDYGTNKSSDDKMQKSAQSEIFKPQEHKIQFHRIPNSVVKLIENQSELVHSSKSSENIDKSSVNSQLNETNRTENVPVITQQSKVIERTSRETTVLPKFIQKITTTNLSSNLLNEQLKDTSNTSTSSLVLCEAPELKMTAHVVHQKEPIMHITTRTEPSDEFGNGMSDETKSVVISIPSPTPSQEQILDNIALQALEGSRKDGKGVENQFQTFEDMLDMIENITGEPPTVLSEPAKRNDNKIELKTNTKSVAEGKDFSHSVETTKTAINNQISVAVSNPPRPSVIPQLSPLSQPTELTTNMANVSQQLRSLLSSLHTTTVSSSTETKVKSMTQKLVTTTTLQTTASSTLKVADDSQSSKTNMSQNLVKTTYTSSHQQALQTSNNTTPVSTITPVSSSGVNGVFAAQNILFNRVVGNFGNNLNNAQERPKAVQMETTNDSNQQQHSATLSDNHMLKKKTTTSTNSSEPPKSTFSLASILQSHSVSSQTSKPSENIVVTSVGHSDFVQSVIQASQQNIAHTSAFVVRNATISQTVSKPQHLQPSETNLHATNLKLKYMRPNVIQNKPNEDLTSSHIKFDELKKDSIENILEAKTSTPPVTVASTVEPASADNNTSSVPTTKDDDSQNVLLKKLLQNTACASTQTPPALSNTITTSTLKQDCNSNSLLLESQLIKTSQPITSIIPPATPHTPKIQQRFSVMTRETSFVSSPTTQVSTAATVSTAVSTPSVVDAKSSEAQLQTEPPKPHLVRAISREEVPQRMSREEPTLPVSQKPEPTGRITPQTTITHIKRESTETITPVSTSQIKREFPVSESSSVLPSDVKKELIDENSQNSESSEAGGRLDYPIKEEPDSVDSQSEKLAFDQKEELKKQKRRIYQQKRRQNQIMNKEMVGGQPKKRARKSSKVEEDYDTFIDGVLTQLRSFPTMNILEPQFHRNFNVVPVHGSGDLTKLGSKEYDYQSGDLTGSYGNASIPGVSDFYSTKPYGDLEPIPKKPSTTQREFYDEEFPLIKFETDEEKQFDLFCREDSPDSIISESSCDSPLSDSSIRFKGLKLIEKEDEDDKKHRMSPVIPIVVPIPIRLKPGEILIKEKEQPMDVDKENVDISATSKPNNEKPTKANGNITVTLTLTSSAAEDIIGVLRDLANILHIPAPTGYQIVERTATPPGQKYVTQKTKGKDKDPVDIQSILNGAAKFCKHCDVIILNKMVRKKVSELPFLAKDSELLCENGELSFCSSSCYMQFSLIHRSPTITEAKALEIIDHLSQKSKEIPQKVQPIVNSSISNESFLKHYPQEAQFKKFMDSDINYPHLDFKSQFPSGLKEQKYTRVESPVQKPRLLFKGTRYKTWTPNCLQANVKFRKPSDKDIIELLYRLGITVTPAKMPEDTRRCIFCQGIGDGVADGPARLLNFDVDKWVHLNCGLWSDGVYETVNGALMNLENALQQSLLSMCVNCNKTGASIRCFKTRCTNVYHLNCAVKDGCVFFKNKTMYCMVHVPKNEKDNELTTLSVSRRVYVNRDENRQVAAVMHHSDTNNILRVGSLILLNIGQLLPHQLQNFHNSNYIYPVGYKIIRFYWSMRIMNKRCRYICSIHEYNGRPEFKVLIQEPPEEDLEYKGSTPKQVWDYILENLAALRKKSYCVQFFPKFVSGEDLFGLAEPAVVRVLESLPGIETLTDYKFKYGRNPLLELPLAINPSGCARTEAKSRSQLHWKRPHTQRTTGTTSRPLFNVAPPLPNIGFLGESCPYSKQFVHSKSSQYKKMKQEWRNNVFLARSKIQGLGLYAARDLEKHTMVIEYIGELIRTELAETREKAYEAKNRGIYMFRLDEDRVVDATLSGGLARYINHSCNPNCVAEIVEVDRDLRIIIFAKRRIQRGEELAYDYKFDIEDDQHKISCMCGAPNCRKWMN